MSSRSWRVMAGLSQCRVDSLRRTLRGSARVPADSAVGKCRRPLLHAVHARRGRRPVLERVGIVRRRNASPAESRALLEARSSNRHLHTRSLGTFRSVLRRYPPPGKGDGHRTSNEVISLHRDDPAAAFGRPLSHGVGGGGDGTRAWTRRRSRHRCGARRQGYGDGSRASRATAPTGSPPAHRGAAAGVVPVRRTRPAAEAVPGWLTRPVANPACGDARGGRRLSISWVGAPAAPRPPRCCIAADRLWRAAGEAQDGAILSTPPSPGHRVAVAGGDRSVPRRSCALSFPQGAERGAKHRCLP